MTTLHEVLSPDEQRGLADFLFHRRGRRTYTAVCSTCYHRAHNHLLNDGLDMYLCRECTCTGGTYVPLSEAEATEFDRRVRQLAFSKGAS